ncbi:endonuclease/exonuclease/phosphatase family protein [Longispora sp. K20-0274]|uniref:endonuclease/exonuclease/phosphatase family protein n=1 Tax=Longispora sp. K20-0274 TaxID=3088255 RepID=UPI0039999247
MTFGVALLIDVLRVWLPSLITVYGAAGSTPAEQIGLFALLVFATALLAVPLARRAGPARFAMVSMVGLVVARVLLQASHGGIGQLVLSTAGLVFGLWWLVALALGGIDGRRALTGVVGGFAVSATGHALLGGLDLMWRHGWWVWAVLVVVGLAALAGTDRADLDSPTPAPDRFWLAVGPALLVFGVLTGSTARAGTLTGVWGVALVVGAGILAVRLARVGHEANPWFGRVACLVLPVGAEAVSRGGWSGVLLTMATALALGPALGLAARPGRSRLPGPAAAAGLLAFVVLFFLYYAAYDLDLPFDNSVVLLVALGVVGVLAVADRPGPVDSDRRRWSFFWAVTLSFDAVLFGGLALLVAVNGQPVVADATPPGMVRLVSYNIRMGFGLDGRFSVDALADTIKSQNPDVVLLSEVDRGWFLNGGHDTLGLLAARLGMRYVFAPAADQVWGDAVLTRAAIVSSRSVALPREGPTGAQALGVVLRVAGGRELAVVCTHFQPAGDSPALSQAVVAARLVGQLAVGGRPVVLAGDLNIEPGAPAFAPLTTAGLTDALAPSRPVPTFPADRPTQQIDHVLVTKGLTAIGVVTPDSRASDHRAVAVSLQLS